jgi:hypothetical protein
VETFVTVIDEKTGKPIEDVRVVIMREEDSGEIDTLMTDEQGRISFRDDRDEYLGQQLVFSVEHQGYRPHRRTHRVDHNLAVTLNIEPQEEVVLPARRAHRSRPPDPARAPNAMDEEPLRKINYFTGFFLRAEDLQAAEAYRDRVRWMHNLLFHGPGVVRGFHDELAVTVNHRGNEITVGTGFAIDPLGRELLLAKPSTHGIPRDEYDLPATLYVTIGYTSQKVDFRVNQGNPDYSGHAFIKEAASVTVTTTPDKAHLELARIHLTLDGTRVGPAPSDHRPPGDDEIDMRQRRWSGIAGSVFRLASDAEIVLSGSAPVEKEARVTIEEVSEGELRVFGISVYSRPPDHIRWYQEAVTTQDGKTIYELVIKNRERNDDRDLRPDGSSPLRVEAHYTVYRLG